MRGQKKWLAEEMIKLEIEERFKCAVERNRWGSEGSWRAVEVSGRNKRR